MDIRSTIINNVLLAVQSLLDDQQLQAVQRAVMLVLEEGRAHADPEFVDLHTAAFA